MAVPLSQKDSNMLPPLPDSHVNLLAFSNGLRASCSMTNFDEMLKATGDDWLKANLEQAQGIYLQ